MRAMVEMHEIWHDRHRYPLDRFVTFNRLHQRLEQLAFG
jgi:hypothetical protein